MHTNPSSVSRQTASAWQSLVEEEAHSSKLKINTIHTLFFQAIWYPLVHLWVYKYYKIQIDIWLTCRVFQAYRVSDQHRDACTCSCILQECQCTRRVWSNRWDWEKDTRSELKKMRLEEKEHEEGISLNLQLIPGVEGVSSWYSVLHLKRRGRSKINLAILLLAIVSILLIETIGKSWAVVEMRIVAFVDQLRKGDGLEIKDQVITHSEAMSAWSGLVRWNILRSQRARASVTWERASVIGKGTFILTIIHIDTSSERIAIIERRIEALVHQFLAFTTWRRDDEERSKIIHSPGLEGFLSM